MFKELFLNVRIWFACLFLSKKEAKVIRRALSKPSQKGICTNSSEIYVGRNILECHDG